jgi:hypothetical protein
MDWPKRVFMDLEQYLEFLFGVSCRFSRRGYALLVDLRSRNSRRRTLMKTTQKAVINLDTLNIVKKDICNGGLSWVELLPWENIRFGAHMMPAIYWCRSCRGCSDASILEGRTTNIIASSTRGTSAMYDVNVLFFCLHRSQLSNITQYNAIPCKYSGHSYPDSTCRWQNTENAE